MSNQPAPTRCPHCGTVAAEWICHICKMVKRDPDTTVGICSLLVSVPFLFLMAIGAA